MSSNPCGTCSTCREIDEGRFPDLIEVDAASQTQVENTRALLDNVQYAPTRGRYKVYLIDEVHMLSKHSFNALLKTLEEPPAHVKFLLATTDPQKLPVTVLSRCLRFNLKRLSTKMIADRMRYIAKAEALAFEEGALTLLAGAAEGSVRDGLSLMDQLIAFGGGALTEGNARTMLGTIDSDHIERILQAILEENGDAVLREVESLDQDSPDYDRALTDLATTLQQIAVRQLIPGSVSQEGRDNPAIARLAAFTASTDVERYYTIALRGRAELALAPSPRIGFEMTLLRMLAFRPELACA
jgi:DNA polymerase-3 subunit gamma/tau